LRKAGPGGGLPARELGNEEEGEEERGRSPAFLPKHERGY